MSDDRREPTPAGAAGVAAAAPAALEGAAGFIPPDLAAWAMQCAAAGQSTPSIFDALCAHTQRTGTVAVSQHDVCRRRCVQLRRRELMGLCNPHPLTVGMCIGCARHLFVPAAKLHEGLPDPPSWGRAF